jgi:hypothetical protein
MGVVPTSRIGKIEFYEQHLPAWVANAAGIGVAPADLTALSALVTSARASFNAAETARDVSKSSTSLFYSRVANMHDRGAILIKTIKNYAESKNDPNVYVLAQIPPPADPSPVPPPGQATDFGVTLGGSGELVLSWKAQHPAGSDRVVYFIGRKLPGESTFAIVGAVGEREFTDASVPSSAAGVGVTYQVTAQRGQVAGTPSVPITITFGIGGSGFTITSLSGAKLAA